MNTAKNFTKVFLNKVHQTYHIIKQITFLMKFFQSDLENPIFHKNVNNNHGSLLDNKKAHFNNESDNKWQSNKRKCARQITAKFSVWKKWSIHKTDSIPKFFLYELLELFQKGYNSSKMMYCNQKHIWICVRRWKWWWWSCKCLHCRCNMCACIDENDKWFWWNK